MNGRRRKVSPLDDFLVGFAFGFASLVVYFLMLGDLWVQMETVMGPNGGLGRRTNVSDGSYLDRILQSKARIVL